mmetsp:Transcript_7330/g.22505  ORF Transcript_7330/g.22505 Transcript_7330/m.22505 type:complete len:227 (+) Transcript_7330:646-1326(+)
MRTDSWRSVPRTARPPSARTSSRSASTTSENAAFTAPYASRQLAAPGTSVRADGGATATAQNSSMRSNATDAFTSVELSAAPKISSRKKTAASAAAAVSRASSDASSSGTGYSVLSTSTSAPRRPSTAGATASLRRSRAVSAAFPPSKMSVPRPAMFVAIVTAPFRPAWLMISDSFRASFGFALRTLCGTSSFRSSSETRVASSMDVVPQSTGWPRWWRSLMSRRT